MKQLKILIFLLLIVSGADKTVAQINSADENTRVVEEINYYQNEIAKTQDAIQKKKNEIAKTNRELTQLKQSDTVTVDTVLIARYRLYLELASRFVYTPYEQFSIENIALPAFDTQSIELTPNDKTFLKLLKNYKSDIQAIIAFLRSAEIDPKGAYSKLKNLQVYKDYIELDDWQNTYLGRIMAQTENLLNGNIPDGTSKISAIKNQLEHLLK